MLRLALIICCIAGCMSERPTVPVNASSTLQGGKKYSLYPSSVQTTAVQTTERSSRYNFPSSRGLSTKKNTWMTREMMTSTMQTPNSGNKTEETKCAAMFSCYDCSTAEVCRSTENGYVKTFTLPCPHTAPYCSFTSGTCSTEPDPRCMSPDSFVCPDDGYFPDPTNCTIYHLCNNYESELYKCPEGQIYNPEKSECCQGTTCNYTINCAGVTENKLKMGSTQFFTYCSGGMPLIVSKCPGEYKLNSTTQVCEPICEKDGLMADLEDCTKYFRCSTLYINNKLSVPIRENLPCPLGEAFEPTKRQCVQKLMTNCKTPQNIMVSI